MIKKHVHSKIGLGFLQLVKILFYILALLQVFRDQFSGLLAIIVLSVAVIFLLDGLVGNYFYFKRRM